MFFCSLNNDLIVLGFVVTFYSVANLFSFKALFFFFLKWSFFPFSVSSLFFFFFFHYCMLATTWTLAISFLFLFPFSFMICIIESTAILFYYSKYSLFIYVHIYTEVRLRNVYDYFTIVWLLKNQLQNK